MLIGPSCFNPNDYTGSAPNQTIFPNLECGEGWHETNDWECMYVCMYRAYLGLRARQHLRSLMDDYDGQMIFGDLVGLKLPDIRLTGEENPEKTSPRKPVPTGDRTRARCVTSAHATTCSTAVDDWECEMARRGRGLQSDECWWDWIGETGEPREKLKKSRYCQSQLTPWRHRESNSGHQ